MLAKIGAAATAGATAAIEGAAPIRAEWTNSAVSLNASKNSPSENLSYIFPPSSVIDILISGLGLDAASFLYWVAVSLNDLASSSNPNLAEITPRLL